MSNPSLNHLHIYTNHMDEMTKLWVAATNAVIEGPAQYGGEEAVHLMSPENIRIVIQKKSAPAADTVNYVTGINHVGILVDDIKKTLEALLALPMVEIDKDIFDLPAFHCAFVRGPDNLRLELMQKRIL